MAWAYLSFAILFEVSGTISMKYSEGFTKITPTALLILFYLASLFFLTLTLKAIEISTAYAVWSGMGILIISLIGIFYFNEKLNILKVIAILFIVIGVTILNFNIEVKSEGAEIQEMN